VAECHYRGWNGLKQDFKKAFEMYLKIEKETNGDHWAQWRLGWCYRYGRGTDQDHNKGFEFYTKSAEQGNSVAMNNLGTCYDYGFGCGGGGTFDLTFTLPDGDLGFRLKENDCSVDRIKNNEMADQLGIQVGDVFVSISGTLIIQSAESAERFEQVRDLLQNEPRPLQVVLRRRNLTKVFEWYEKSAKLGYSRAMLNVGACYKNGDGVTKDLNKATEWFTKAAAQGRVSAQAALDRLN